MVIILSRADISIYFPNLFPGVQTHFRIFENPTQCFINMFFICELVLSLSSKFSMFVVKEVSLCLYWIYRPHLPSANHVNAEELYGALRMVTKFGRRTPMRYKAWFGVASHQPHGASESHCQSKHTLAFKLAHIECLEEEGRKWKNHLRVLCRRKGGAMSGTDVRVYQRYIQPLFEIATSAWCIVGRFHVRKLQTIQNLDVKMADRLTTYTLNTFIVIL